DDQMMADDYDYDSDDPSTASQTKASNIASEAPARNRSRTVTGILGDDVPLKCDDNISKDDVVMWYGSNTTTLISQGRSLLMSNYALNLSNFELTIVKASPQSAGDYYCRVMPSSEYIHTKVVLGDHLLNVVPESSTSGQSSLFVGLALWSSLLTAALMLKH
ncbi:hypothetical protein KR222_008514, partial [Zaprionus bogoriensis]